MRRLQEMDDGSGEIVVDPIESDSGDLSNSGDSSSDED
jgi:hypothetical protein